MREVVFRQFILESMTPLGDQYYKGADETRRGFVELSKKLAEKEPGLVGRVLLASRKAKYKAPAILGAHFLKGSEGRKWRRAILSTFPMDMLYQYVRLHKEEPATFTLGRRKKEDIAEVIVDHGVHWNALQALKKRDKMRKVLKVTHPRPNSDQLDAVFKFVLGRAKPPIGVELIDNAHKFVELVREKQYEKAIELAVQAKLPFSLVASNVPRDVMAGRPELEQIMSTFDKAMYGRLLAEWLGLDKAVAKIASETPLDYALRATMTLAGDNYELRRAALNVLAKRLKDVVLNDVMAKSGVQRGKGALVLDFSCSMDRHFDLVKLYAIAFADLVGENIVGFPQTTPRVMSLNEVLEVDVGDCGGTPLYESVELAYNEFKPDYLIVVTDEQENASSVERLKEAIGANVPIIVLNPTTYRAHYLKSSILLPARPSGLVEALRFFDILSAPLDELIDEIILFVGDSDDPIRYVNAYKDKYAYPGVGANAKVDARDDGQSEDEEEEEDEEYEEEEDEC